MLPAPGVAADGITLPAPGVAPLGAAAGIDSVRGPLGAVAAAVAAGIELLRAPAGTDPLVEPELVAVGAAAIAPLGRVDGVALGAAVAIAPLGRVGGVALGAAVPIAPLGRVGGVAPELAGTSIPAELPLDCPEVSIPVGHVASFGFDAPVGELASVRDAPSPVGHVASFFEAALLAPVAFGELADVDAPTPRAVLLASLVDAGLVDAGLVDAGLAAVAPLADEPVAVETAPVEATPVEAAGLFSAVPLVGDAPVDAAPVDVALVAGAGLAAGALLADVAPVEAAGLTAVALLADVAPVDVGAAPVGVPVFGAVALLVGAAPVEAPPVEAPPVEPAGFAAVAPLVDAAGFAVVASLVDAVGFAVVALPVGLTAAGEPLAGIVTAGAPAGAAAAAPTLVVRVIVEPLGAEVLTTFAPGALVDTVAGFAIGPDVPVVVLATVETTARGDVVVRDGVGGLSGSGVGSATDCFTSLASCSSWATGVCWSCSHSWPSIASISTTESSAGGFVIAWPRRRAPRRPRTLPSRSRRRAARSWGRARRRRTA